MNQMLKIVFVMTAMMAAVGCKTNFDGAIKINQKMTVKLKKDYGTVAPGTYASTIKFSSKKKAVLEIKVNGSGGKNPELPIAIPRSEELPEYNGPISWRAEEIGQTFDVEGSLNTVVTDTERRRGTETCQERIPYRECYTDPQGRPVCRDGWRDATGSRVIDYYDRTYDRNVKLTLLDPKKGAVLAGLSGKNVQTERIVLSQGMCRAYGRQFDSFGRSAASGLERLFHRQ